MLFRPALTPAILGRPGISPVRPPTAVSTPNEVQLNPHCVPVRFLSPACWRWLRHLQLRPGGLEALHSVLLDLIGGDHDIRRKRSMRHERSRKRQHLDRSRCPYVARPGAKARIVASATLLATGVIASSTSRLICWRRHQISANDSPQASARSSSSSGLHATLARACSAAGSSNSPRSIAASLRSPKSAAASSRTAARAAA